jgi:hypothetical protein
MVKSIPERLTGENPAAGVFMHIQPVKSMKESLRTAFMMAKEPRHFLTAGNMSGNSARE